ncbi:MAG: hypothetical protein ACFFED_06650 [Candidatus Thorarchaeota archaeon]
MGVREDVVPNILMVIVVIDAILFFATSRLVQYHHWTTDWQGTSHGDHWGWRVSPVYFTYIALSLSLSLIILVAYPFFLQSRANVDAAKGRMLRKRYLLMGLLIPFLYQYSDLQADIYGYSDFGATITQVAIPILPFIPFYSTLLMMQTTLVGLALIILTIVGIIKYENGAISYRAFLLPIVLTLLFSLSVLSFTLYNLVVSNQLLVLIPVPSFSLGVLLYARELYSDSKSSSHSSEESVQEQE